MTKIILLLLLAVVSRNVLAEWVVEGENEDEVFYSSHESIRWKGGTVKMLVLLDKKKAQETATGKKFMSVEVRNEFDCSAEKARMLYAYYYSDKNTKGDVLLRIDEPSNWMQVTPNSRDQALWNVACGKE